MQQTFTLLLSGEEGGEGREEYDGEKKKGWESEGLGRKGRVRVREKGESEGKEKKEGQ